jgi:flagellar basal body-associated protein FliL
MIFSLTPFKKKGSAQIWWIIIGAVVALLVMVILLVIFSDKGKDLSVGISDCQSKQGRCVPVGACSGSVSSIFSCDSDGIPGTVCCFS